MSAWMFWGYADRKVELGEWTKEEAIKFIEEINRIDLQQNEIDREMIKRCRMELQKSKN